MSKPEINVTPLIDVLLVLLIIFMIVSPMKQSSFKASLPQEPKHNSPIEPAPDTLVVAIAKDTSLRINFEDGLGTVENPAKTIERLIDVFRLRRESYVGSSLDEATVPKTVFIKAPSEINYGSVVKVMDAVKASGADPVSLQIDDLD
jgi:biopolymer transport protein ExbD